MGFPPPMGMGMPMGMPPPNFPPNFRPPFPPPGQGFGASPGMPSPAFTPMPVPSPASGMGGARPGLPGVASTGSILPSTILTPAPALSAADLAVQPPKDGVMWPDDTASPVSTTLALSEVHAYTPHHP